VGYEVTYNINHEEIVVVNMTSMQTNFITPALCPGSSVSNITVTAFTKVGGGEIARHTVYFTPEIPLLREFCVQGVVAC